MPGVTLSRWTMAYFAAALAALLAAELMMTLGYGYPAMPVEAPQTLVLVHVTAIGWLSLLICGALFQFVPVLVARPLHSDALPLPTLAVLLAGLAALLLGFLQMDGKVPPGLPAFPAAAILLGVGFALVLWNLGRTLCSARPLPLPARFVVVGLFCAAATVALGMIFALVLGGATDDPRLAALTASGVPLHAVAGLGGWLTFTAIGVSYRLLAMFMLAPELDGPRTRLGFYCGTAALATAILGGTVAISAGFGPGAILVAAGALGLCALGLYGTDILHLYRARKRRIIELNSRMAAFAVGSLIAAAIAIAATLALGSLERHAPAAVFLLGFGWLSGLGLAKLYKIVAFLTWLECYGPVLGKVAAPRVQDLVVERRAGKWFILYFIAVWAATIALFVDVPIAFRAGAAAMTVASLGIIVQLVRTRLLRDLGEAIRTSAGVRPPALLHASLRHA